MENGGDGGREGDVSRQLFAVDFTFGMISLIGAYIIITSCLLNPHLRQFPYNLVCYLALCDFCFSLKFFVSAVFIIVGHTPCDGLVFNDFESEGDICLEEGWVCYLSSLWTQFWALGTISWNGMISLNLILSLRNPFVYSAQYLKLYHFYVWSLSSSLTLLMAVSGAFCPPGDCECRWWGFRGQGDYSCWINGTSFSGQLSFFIPLFLTFLLGIASLFTSLYRTKNVFGDSKVRQDVLLRQTVYVGAFMIIWSGPIANRGFRLYSSLEGNANCIDICLSDKCDSSVGHFLTILEELCLAAQGFVNSVIWLSNPYFSNQLKTSCVNRCYVGASNCLCCCCLRGSETKSQSAFFDEDIQDFNRIAAFLRKFFILFMAFGISKSANEAEKKWVQEESTYLGPHDGPVDPIFTREFFARVFSETVEDPTVNFPLSDLRSEMRRHRRRVKDGLSEDSQVFFFLQDLLSFSLVFSLCRLLNV
mmetsp:Transcript_38397/g.53446  ORF Transcript_38397/g.53446 Transcript_38397/m.53446 type:complete len:476 (-) Transcript_38397:1966-3393(-)